jgi:hypothetical protein
MAPSSGLPLCSTQASSRPLPRAHLIILACLSLCVWALTYSGADTGRRTLVLRQAVLQPPSTLHPVLPHRPSMRPLHLRIESWGSAKLPNTRTTLRGADSLDAGILGRLRLTPLFLSFLLLSTLLSVLAAPYLWPQRQMDSLAAATGRKVWKAPKKAAADSKKQLELANQHPRDKLARYDSVRKGFTYLAPNGTWQKPTSTVTAFVYSLFPEFDADKAIDSMMASPTWPPEKYVNPQTGEAYSRPEIRNLWKEKSKESKERGTAMHESIANDLNGLPTDDPSPELNMFRVLQTEVLAPRGIRPVRTEMPVFDEDLDLMGSIDFLGQDASGAFHLAEWKRSEDFEKKAVEVYASAASASWPVEHLPNNNAMKLALQLNMYARLLERKYGLRIAGLWAGVFHPDRTAPMAVQIPFLDREVDCLCALRRLDVVAAWRTGKPVTLDHARALETLSQQDEPTVQAFFEAFDQMRAKRAAFLQEADEKVRHKLLVEFSKGLLRTHTVAAGTEAVAEEEGEVPLLELDDDPTDFSTAGDVPLTLEQ